MRTLLRALWPDLTISGAITFWFNPSKESFHLPLEQLALTTAEDEAELRTLVGNRNVYFGLALRQFGLGTHRVGRKKDIVALSGAVLDIDFFNPKAHKALNLPKDFEEASVLLAGLPDPSAIVFTGNGVHVYWFFRRPLILDSVTRQNQAQKMLKQFQAPIIKLAKEKHGWQLDSTASIQHVFRVPGFINLKTDKEVELWYCNENERYELSDLGMRMPEKRGEYKKPTPSASLLSQPQLNDLRDQLQRVSPNKRWHKAIKAMLEGKSMAKPGERDQVLQGVCSTIAWLPAGRRARPRSIVEEILRPSLEVWAAEEDADKTIEDELEKAADKIERSQEDYWEQQAAARPQLEGLARSLGVSLDPDQDPEVLAEKHEFLLQHAVIQYKKIYYLFDFGTNEYAPRPFQPSELLGAARDAWKDGPNQLSTHYVNDKGQTKLKVIPMIIDEYGTVAFDAVGNMTIDQSEYQAGRKLFIEACARKRITEPKFDEQIDQWLRHLAGDNYEKVCDWIAALPQLEYQNCALYLDGFSGSGKGLLAMGLARLWRDGAPTLFTDVTKGEFNAEIIKCPLLWIDEGISGRRDNITADLRSLVGRSSFSLNEKFEPIRPVTGAIRLLICANNENVLMFGNSEMSTRDLEAVVGRIMHVPAKAEGATFLIEHSDGGKLTRKWVEGGGIARHCLHLAQTRKLIPGKRFLVEGDETEMHRQLVLQGDTNGLVYEWLTRFATNPQKIATAYKGKNSPPLALIGGGEILVNTQCVIDCWKTYMPEDISRPQTGRIGRVLTRISDRVARLGARGNRNRFHVIKADMILEWCRQQQVGNEDKIEDNLKKEIDLGVDAD